MAGRRAAGRDAGARRQDVATTSRATPIAGKRKAVKSRSKPLSSGPRQPLESHRTQTAARATAPQDQQQSGGRRKAVTHRTTRSRGLAFRFPLPSKLPSLPALIGSAAVVVAATGALTVTQAPTATLASGTVQSLAGVANALNGASGVGSSNPLRDRKLAVSRDAARADSDEAERDKLLLEAEQQDEEFQQAIENLAARSEAHAAEVAKNAWKIPVTPGVYRLTAGFGQCSGLWSHCHTGLDFAAPSGTSIFSVANGVVVSTGYDGAYGNKTIIQLEDGTEIWYCHQSSILVSPGETVVGGQQIGTIGTTGNTTGAHLHLEVRPGAGDAVDPYSALIAHGLTP